MIAFSSITAQIIGTPVTLTASTTSGLAVTFDSTTSTTCTVTDTTVMLIATGTCTIQATQAGNRTYSAAPLISRSFPVKLQPQTIMFEPISTQTVDATLALAASANSRLSVSFSSQISTVCTVSDTTAMMIKKGTCRIAATQSGDATYAAASSVLQSSP